MRRPELLKTGLISLLLVSFLVIAGCREKAQEASPLPTPSGEALVEAALDDPIGFLTRFPIYLLPGASKGYYACNILWSSLHLWEEKGGGEPPLTVSDLWERGYILWNLRHLTQADEESLRKGDGRFYSTVLRDLGEDRGRTGVAVICYASIGPYHKKPWEGHADLWAKPASPERENRTQSAGKREERELKKYISQARNGLALYYLLQKKQATSRRELEEVLGQESSAWKDPALSELLETLIKKHSVRPLPRDRRRSRR